MPIDETLEPGTVVRLRSGGPEMTVKSDNDGLVHVYWWCNVRDEFAQGLLPRQVLELRDPDF